MNHLIHNKYHPRIHLIVSGDNLCYCDLYYPIKPIFEYAVCFFDLVQRECVGYQGRGVDAALLDELQRLGAVAAVNAAGLECQVLAVHIGQRQRLDVIIARHHGDNGVGPCRFPGHAEGFRAARHFNHYICAAVIAVFQYKILYALGLCGQYIGVMLFYKCASGIA